jgi:hypothetical protein
MEATQQGSRRGDENVVLYSWGLGGIKIEAVG